MYTLHTYKHDQRLDIPMYFVIAVPRSFGGGQWCMCMDAGSLSPRGRQMMYRRRPETLPSLPLPLFLSLPPSLPLSLSLSRPLSSPRPLPLPLPCASVLFTLLPSILTCARVDLSSNGHRFTTSARLVRQGRRTATGGHRTIRPEWVKHRWHCHGGPPILHQSILSIPIHTQLASAMNRM